MARPRILIIYTGGTIGMVHDSPGGPLVPFSMEALLRRVPTIGELGIDISTQELSQVIDSSGMTPAIWKELALLIGSCHDSFDGFVVLHGSDTMAYTASALSFMLRGLGRPVILTGSQLPIGLVRSDARENLITSLILASMRDEKDRPLINEVCVFFEATLFRGNRTHKFNAENFDAFRSVNYPPLAEAGVHLRVHNDRLLPRPTEAFMVLAEMDAAVATVRLFPGIDLAPYVQICADGHVRGLVLETFGSGNGPDSKVFLNDVTRIVEMGIPVLNITQCRGGRVNMEKYATGRSLAAVGVVSGADMTIEAGLAKMMHLLANISESAELVRLLSVPICGELTR
jgi:L-asparaginase